MKKLTIIIIILLSFKGYSQDYDQMMVKKQVECSDIAYNCGLYFMKYVQENKTDSVTSLLDYWSGKCGMREPIFRAMLLYELQQDGLNDSLIREGFINFAFNYKSRMDMIRYNNYFNYELYQSYYGYTPPGQEFDNFTRQLAAEMKERYDPHSPEFLVCEFYSDNSDTIFSKIQSPEYLNNILSTEYYKAVEDLLRMPEYHYSWITGMWIPTGELKELGIHPELGFQVGVKHKKMNYDLTMTFKFARTPDYYYARRTSRDTLELTDYFFGGYIGLDIGRDLLVRNGNEIQITGGIAYDGFSTFDTDVDDDLESGSVNSYNFNIGLGYRYYISDGFYLGLRAKYNFVDYTLQDIIAFSGNPVTVQFIIGGLGNKDRNGNLKALKYELRK
jgi:hypothetical protein